jgi:hypothetical protein
MFPRSVDSAAREDSSIRKPDFFFTTSNTLFASYLTATGKLRYRGARLSEVHDGVEFLFADEAELGPKLQLDFKTRNADPVNPVTLFEALGFLKSEVKRIKGGMANAKPIL